MVLSPVNSLAKTALLSPYCSLIFLISQGKKLMSSDIHNADIKVLDKFLTIIFRILRNTDCA